MKWLYATKYLTNKQPHSHYKQGLLKKKKKKKKTRKNISQFLTTKSRPASAKQRNGPGSSLLFTIHCTKGRWNIELRWTRITGWHWSLHIRQKCAMALWTVSQTSACMSVQSGPKVRKLFSCSTQLNMKFSLLINMKMPTNFLCTGPYSWHFHIYQQRTFHALLCLARKNLQLLVIWDLLAEQISCSAELSMKKVL